MKILQLTSDLKPIISINNTEFVVNNLSLFLPNKKYSNIAKEIPIKEIKIIFKNNNLKNAYSFFDHEQLLKDIYKNLSVVLVFDRKTNYLIDIDKNFSINRTNIKTSNGNYYNDDYIFYFITEKEFSDNNKYSAIISDYSILFTPIESSIALELTFKNKIAKDIVEILKENYNILFFEKLPYKIKQKELKVANNYIEYIDNNVKMYLLHKKDTSKEIDIELELETLPNDKKAIKYSVYENGKLKKTSTHEVDENNIHLVIPRLINIKRKDAKLIWQHLNEKGKVKIKRKIGRKDEIYLHKEASNYIFIRTKPEIIKIANNLYLIANDIKALKNKSQISMIPLDMKVPFNIFTNIFPLNISDNNDKIAYIIYKKANGKFDYYSNNIIAQNINIHDLLFPKTIKEKNDIKLALLNGTEIYAINVSNNKKAMLIIDNYENYEQIAKELNRKLGFYDEEIIKEKDIKNLFETQGETIVKYANVKYYKNDKENWHEIKTIKYDKNSNKYKYAKLLINEDAYTLINDVKFASYNNKFIPIIFAHKDCIYGKYSIKYNGYEYSITKADNKIKISKNKLANYNDNLIEANLYAIFKDDKVLKKIKNDNLKKYAKYDDNGYLIFEINGKVIEKTILNNIKEAHLNKNEILDIIENANLPLLNKYVIKKFTNPKLNKYKISKIDDGENIRFVIQNLDNIDERYEINNLNKIAELLNYLNNYDNATVNNVFFGKKIAIDNEGINLMLIPSVFGPQSAQAVLNNPPIPFVINLPLQQAVIPPLSLLLSRIYSINYIPVPELPILDNLPTIFAGIIRQQDTPDTIEAIINYFKNLTKQSNLIINEDFKIADKNKLNLILQANEDLKLEIIKPNKLEYKYNDIVNKKAYDLNTINKYYNSIDKDKINAIINFPGGFLNDIYNGRLADNGIEIGNNYILIKSPDNKKFVYIRYNVDDNIKEKTIISLSIDNNYFDNWGFIDESTDLDEINDNSECVYDLSNKTLYLIDDKDGIKAIPIAFNIDPELIEKINQNYNDIIKISHDITPLYATEEYSSAFDLNLIKQTIEEMAEVDPYMAELFEIVVNFYEHPELTSNLIDSLKYIKKMIAVLMIFSTISDTPLQYSFLNNLLQQIYDFEKKLNSIASEIIRKYYVSKEIQKKLERQAKKLAKK